MLGAEVLCWTCVMCLHLLCLLQTHACSAIRHDSAQCNVVFSFLRVMGQMRHTFGSMASLPAIPDDT